MPSGVNETAIVLLPKKEELDQLKDFRPISLCNVIYKVISKCLVNRLRPLLQDLIAPTECFLSEKCLRSASGKPECEPRGHQFQGGWK
jgi:hypothetical protein